MMPTLSLNAKKNLTLGQNSQKYFNLRPNYSTQTCFGLGFNFMA
jgi:hypothetical protein